MNNITAGIDNTKSGFVQKYSGRICISLLVVYVACILYLTLICRQSQGRILELIPFWSYVEALRGAQGMWFQIAANFALFIPIGILVGGINSNKQVIIPAAIVGLAISVTIETCQYIFAIGTCEIDDLFDNTAGAVIGALIFLLLRRVKIWRILAICIGLVACVLGIAYCVSYDFNDNSATHFEFQVDSIQFTNNQLKIEGYAFMYLSYRNEDTAVDGSPDEIIPAIYLKSTNEIGKMREMKLEYGIARQDVNNYFKCEYDYTHTGFKATIDATAIDKNAEYEILVKYPGVFSPFHSGNYICRNEVYRISRNEYIEPEVKGTDLENIVNSKSCVVYNPDHHCWVYQKDNKLFWIVDENFYFEDDGSTYIQYQIDTTQFDKLPKDRFDNGWYWSNIGGNFEDYEITDDMNCGKYRVCCREIPQEYSVTAIYTGYYTDEHWVWQECFRPMYDKL